MDATGADRDTDSYLRSHPARPAPAATVKANGATSKAIQFISNAGNETLIACAIGASAVLYMVLGRLGLLLIGVVAGVVLHATWERHNGNPHEADKEAKRRKEVGLDIARRLLDWTDARHKMVEDVDLDTKAEVALKMATRQELDYSEYPRETASALRALTDAVIQDYVKFWYTPMLPGEDSFPSAARQILTGFVLAFCNHQARKRPADVLLNFLTNATSIFIVFLSELSKALMSPDVLDLEASEALHLYLDRSQTSNLANIADRDEQERKLLAVSDDFLQSFLDPKTYNCEPARLFLRQVFSGVVLQSILNSISQPEWINGWIVYLLEEGEPELIMAIDAGVERAADKVQGSAEGTSSSTEPMQGAAGSVSNGHEERRSTDLSARQNRLSQAGDAMQAAMDEAKRLTEMIQAAEHMEIKPGDDTSPPAFTTNAQVTPNLSQDDFADANGPKDTMPSGPIGAVDSTPATNAEPSPSKQFTSFDQITPPYRQLPEPKAVPPLTLHNAKIAIFDDSQPGDKTVIKSKPQSEYLLQIEPSSALHSGWMVPRKHSEIGPLHEYLYKIANVSGAPAFARKYQDVPSYKGKTKDGYRRDLEQYFHDVLSYEPLAESEGMKRFLDKDQGFAKSGANKNPLAFAAPVGDAFQTVGKGMLGGLNTATKGITTGGQAVFGGVGGLFGGPKRAPTSPKPSPQPESVDNGRGLVEADNRRGSRDIANPSRSSIEKREQSSDPSRLLGIGISGLPTSDSEISLGTAPALPPRRMAKDPPLVQGPSNPTVESTLDTGSLPTPPAFVGDSVTSLPGGDPPRAQNVSEVPLYGPSLNSELNSDHRSSETARDLDQVRFPDAVGNSSDSALKGGDPASKASAPLDEQETRVAIELMFAAINELYTLSSAWNIRRTLLNAAKSYLLRPGNLSLLSIQELLQSNILNGNTSDDAIAAHIRKLRQNSLPTEAELASWPPAPSEQEKEKLREKARRLLVTKGMPQTLTSVMGAAASGEALGRVFDALQVERVSRALMFALLLQGIRAAIS